METRAHHVLIGLFIVILSGGALMLALALSQPDTRDSYTYYRVVFNEAVTGLSKGSTVQYSGIKIGDVTELALDSQNPNKVWVRIRVEERIPIKQDTQAILTVTGITGVSVIQLTGGTAASPRLVSDTGEDPVIIAGRSPLAKLFEGGGDMMSNVNELVLNTRQIISPENSQRISTILGNLEGISSGFADQDGELSALVNELTIASQQARATLKKTEALVGNADQLLTAHGAKILSNANKTMASLERTSSRLEHLMVSNDGALNNGLQGLNYLAPVLLELRGTLADIRVIARELQENPSGYLFGQKTLKEFEP